MPEKDSQFEFEPNFKFDHDMFKTQSFEIPVVGHFYMHTPVKDTIDMIDKVIYHDPATIIYWKDRTKTVVKCQEGFEYDEVVGYLMCILKKTLNGRQYTKLCDELIKPFSYKTARKSFEKTYSCQK